MQYQGKTLDPFQEQAMDAIDDGRSVLVSAPTGTGKTLIADYLIDQTLSEGGQIIYTAPIKALSNQKYREYSRLFGEDQVGLITGDIVINPYAPLRIMTTEILRNILLQEAPGESDSDSDEDILIPSQASFRDLDDLRAVVIDEIHFLDDPDRGTVWEELLIYLPNSIQVLGLSATLSNLDVFCGWLSAIRGEDVEVVVETERSVPLRIQLTNREVETPVPVKAFEKKFRTWRKESAANGKKRTTNRRGKDRRGKDRKARFSRTKHLDIFRELPIDHYPALYFIYSRKMTEQLAFELSDTSIGKGLIKRTDSKAIADIVADFDDRHPGVLKHKLRRALKCGIACHHAGLHVALKSLIERLYEERLLNVLYCTSTFALGINMPARTVVFDSVTKFNGVDIVPLTVREFMQMAGRAGRRGIDSEGDVILKVDFREFEEYQAAIDFLLLGESEPVSSSFNLSFNSIVNLLSRYNEDQIRTLLERSFRAHEMIATAESIETELEHLESNNSPNRRRIAQLKRQLADAKRPRLWEQFQRKLTFLRSYDYIDSDLHLSSRALILQKIQFEEIFVTELIYTGALESLNGEELFGVMCGLAQTLPRTANVTKPTDDKWWDIFDEIADVAETDVVFRAQKLTLHETVYTPELMPLGEMWAQGESLETILQSISNPTDLSGDIVGAFRRAKDLVGQIRRVYWDDIDRRKELLDVIRAVTRDEVEVID